jgi:histone H3/H4
MTELSNAPIRRIGKIALGDEIRIAPEAVIEMVNNIETLIARKWTAAKTSAQNEGRKTIKASDISTAFQN